MKLTFSEKIFKCLLEKVEGHNNKYPQKVSIHQLIRVYKRGEEAAERAWRPQIAMAQAAMARVNLFLRLASERKVDDFYITQDRDILMATHRTYQNELNEPFCKFEGLDYTAARSDLLLAHIADGEANGVFVAPEIEES